MNFRLRLTFLVLAIVAACIIGFVFLLRGCLSKYDERSAFPRVLYFEKDSQAVVFSIVKFEKAVSYSRSGGFTRKSVSTNYFIQTNDAKTGKRIGLKKIRHQRDIKNYPVEVLGESKIETTDWERNYDQRNIAWTFIGEIIAFDPFTLKTVLNADSLQIWHPELRDNLPLERQYYQFDRWDESLFITAKDGTKWKLNGHTLKLLRANEGGGPSEIEKETQLGLIKEYDSLLKHVKYVRDSLKEEVVMRPTRRYAAGEIDFATYKKAIKGFPEEDEKWRLIADTVKYTLNELKAMRENLLEGYRNVEELDAAGLSFNTIKVNETRSSPYWYGLYSQSELMKLDDRIDFRRSMYDETARRQLYFGVENFELNKVSTKRLAHYGAKNYFLDGGFLLSKSSAVPLETYGGIFMVVSKSEVGNNGHIIVNGVLNGGTIQWSFDTGLTKWEYYTNTGSKLIVMGTDNKELSGGDCNVLLCIDLSNGRAVKYDFFGDR